jgi:hypothetical protein
MKPITQNPHCQPITISTHPTVNSSLSTHHTPHTGQPARAVGIKPRCTRSSSTHHSQPITLDPTLLTHHSQRITLDPSLSPYRPACARRRDQTEVHAINRKFVREGGGGDKISIVARVDGPTRGRDVVGGLQGKRYKMYNEI